MNNRRLVIDLTPGGQLAAALARAEAAEASREALADRLVFEMEQRETLAARVAELEATLISNSELDNGPWHVLSETVAERNRLADRVAELEAAQQWRPVTEKPEPDQEVEIVIEATFDDYGPGGWTSYGYYFAADYPTGWRPLPPAPQEPTQ